MWFGCRLTYVLHSPKCQADCGTGNGVSISIDDRKTWSASKDVSKDWGPAAGSLPGPGNGVQTSSGRLLVAAHHSAYVHDFVVWSDDEGDTWTPCKQTFPKMDEATMTQLPNGSVSGLPRCPRATLPACFVAVLLMCRLRLVLPGDGQHASHQRQDGGPRSGCLQ